MSEQPIEIKPKFGPVTINVIALWRWFKQRSKTDRVSLAAQRFLELFEAHGIAATQIQHFLPQLTFDKVKSPESLLPSLTNTVLDQTAKLFSIRREWLEGLDVRIYEQQWCYKQSERFFDVLKNIKHDSSTLPIRALCSVSKLDIEKGRPQEIALVFVERIRNLGEEQINRYIIWEDEWDWGYWKTRIQLKAMVRVVQKVIGRIVPLYLVDQQTIHLMRSGHLFPHKYVEGRHLFDVSLEDYSLTEAESAVAKECEELPAVLEYMKAHRLPTSLDEIFRPESELKPRTT